VRVPGTAIYLTRSLHGVPQVLLHNLEHNHVLHEQIIVLTIVTTNEPYVGEAHLVKIRSFGENRNFYRVKLYYGFKQNADVRRALELCVQEGLDFDPKNASFFIGSEQVSFRNKSQCEMAEALFRFYFTILPVRLIFLKYLLTRLWNSEFVSNCNRNCALLNSPARQYAKIFISCSRVLW